MLLNHFIVIVAKLNFTVGDLHPLITILKGWAENKCTVHYCSSSEVKGGGDRSNKHTVEVKLLRSPNEITRNRQNKKSAKIQQSKKQKKPKQTNSKSQLTTASLCRSWSGWHMFLLGLWTIFPTANRFVPSKLKLLLSLNHNSATEALASERTTPGY